MNETTPPCQSTPQKHLQEKTTEVPPAHAFLGNRLLNLQKWHEKWPCNPCFSVPTDVKSPCVLHLCHVAQCIIGGDLLCQGLVSMEGSALLSTLGALPTCLHQCFQLVGGGLWRPKAVPLPLGRRATSWPHLTQPRWLPCLNCV